MTTSNFNRARFLVGSLAFSTLLIAGCDRRAGASSDISFPTDESIQEALLKDYTANPANEQARNLIKLLGGDKGGLNFQVKDVVYRQGSYEIHYNAAIRMGREGADTLRAIYETLIPPADAKAFSDKTLAGYEAWLKSRADSLDKTAPAAATALRTNLDELGKCYRTQKVGDSIEVMTDLRALVSPSRSGLYAEKLESPYLRLKCLPTGV